MITKLVICVQCFCIGFIKFNKLTNTSTTPFVGYVTHLHKKGTELVLSHFIEAGKINWKEMLMSEHEFNYNITVISKLSIKTKTN